MGVTFSSNETIIINTKNISNSTKHDSNIAFLWKTQAKGMISKKTNKMNSIWRELTQEKNPKKSKSKALVYLFTYFEK